MMLQMVIAKIILFPIVRNFCEFNFSEESLWKREKSSKILQHCTEIIQQHDKSFHDFCILKTCLMKKDILFILSVILFASSCFAQQTATPAWQQIFPDPLLQTYINEALENNSDLRTAQLSLEQSEAMLKQARLSYLPSVALSPSGTVTKAQNTSAT